MRHARGVGQVDGGPDDRGGTRVVGHRLHERAVELQLVDRQLAQVGQRGVAGAEVVDRDADAERAQLAEDLAGPLAVGHQEVLGDLQLEHGRRAAVAVAAVRAAPGRQLDVDAARRRTG